MIHLSEMSIIGKPIETENRQYFLVLGMVERDGLGLMDIRFRVTKMFYKPGGIKDNGTE